MVSNYFKVYSSLKRKYIYAFLLIFIFTIIAQIIIQLYIIEQESKSHVINLAGRQRMLSQKIAKSALLLYFSSENANNVKKTLKKDLDLLTVTHENLKNGNLNEDIRAPFTDEIKRNYIALDSYVDRINEHGLCFLDDCSNQDSNIKSLTILTNDFLYKMNELVLKSEKEIKKSIQQLRVIEFILFSIIAIIMIIEFFLILLPFQRSLIKHFKLQMKDEAEREKIYHLAEAGEITSGVIHEINNFMTVVQLASSRIKKKASSDDEEKSHQTLAENINLINQIEKNVKNIVSLSKDMLKVTRVEDLSTFYLQDIIREVEDVTKDKIKENQIEYDVSVLENIVIKNYKMKLVQILINLVKNSIHEVMDFEKRKISVKTNQDEDYLYISVSDNGGGISEENAQKIMDPFFTTKKSGKGTGLGLSLSKKFANSLGGELQITSLRHPTTFELKIKRNND